MFLLVNEWAIQIKLKHTETRICHISNVTINKRNPLDKHINMSHLCNIVLEWRYSLAEFYQLSPACSDHITELDWMKTAAYNIAYNACLCLQEVDNTKENIWSILFSNILLKDMSYNGTKCLKSTLLVVGIIKFFFIVVVNFCLKFRFN